MPPLSEWLPNALVGITFTTLGLLKVYGWRRGILGGRGQPIACRLLGRCPSWSKPVNLGVIVLWLALGLINLGYVLSLCFKAG
jgi:hypothetical protein